MGLRLLFLWRINMEITVNGKLEAIEACSIAEFLAAKGLGGAGVVVEHNY